MTLGRFDVCHGDADGMCAVRQWRLHVPAAATLVTGAKRDIALLHRVPVRKAKEVLVCDLSVQRNHEALLRLLEAGVTVRWFDHHVSPLVPVHPLLHARIDPSPQVCTSLLMDQALDGQFRAWALVGAYGDNLLERAEALGRAAGFDSAYLSGLQQLGEAITYNACSARIEDGCVNPHEVYRRLSVSVDPVRVLERDPALRRLVRLRREDLARAESCPALTQSVDGRVMVLPDETWCRRVAGALADHLLCASPAQAQAVLLMQPDDTLRVSVRAGRSAVRAADLEGADVLCSRFGGGGRRMAAGIDRLPLMQRDRFVRAFEAWAQGSAGQSPLAAPQVHAPEHPAQAQASARDRGRDTVDEDV
jgi:hypothetical protein